MTDNHSKENTHPDGDARDEGVFFASYIEHLKTLRTWLVAYGIGAPVVLATQQHLWATFIGSGFAGYTVKLFLIGVIVQVGLTFLNKTAMWTAAFGERDPEFKDKKAYKIAHAYSRLYVIDFMADLATILLFARATWLAFLALVPHS